MAKLLPRDSFTIHSELSVEAIAQKLSPYVSPRPIIRWAWDKPKTPYHGNLSTSGFELIRSINYRNSFLPLIKGQFEALSQGAAVHITMGLHPVIITFCAVWYLGWYSIGIPLFLWGGMPWQSALVFLGMPLLTGLIFWTAFWSEAKRSRRDLIQMIGGRPVETSHSNSRLGFTTPSSQQFNRKPWILAGIGIAVLALVILLQQQQSAQKSQTASNSLVSPAAVCSASCHYSTLHSITGHPEATVVAVSPDGSLIASGGYDKAIKVWDVKTGQLRQTLQSDSGKIIDLAIAPDNQTIVSGAGDRMLRIWDLNANSKWPQVLKHGSEPRIIRVTQDGKSVISASFDSLQRWDLTSGELLTEIVNRDFKLKQLGPLEFSTSGPYTRVFAINASGTVAVVQRGNDLLAWDLEKNQQVKLPHNPQWSHVRNLAISPNGKVAVSQHDNSWRKFETRLKVWDLTQGKLQAEGAMDFSRASFPDIPMVLSDAQVMGSVDGKLASWAFDTAQRGHVLSEQWVRAIAISPDGQVLAGLENVGGSNATIHLLQRSQASQ